MVDFFQSRYRGPNQADPDQWDRLHFPGAATG